MRFGSGRTKLLQLETDEMSTAEVVFTPTVDQQKAMANEDGSIVTQLATLYDVERTADGGEVEVRMIYS